MGEGDERHDRRIRASIGSASAVSALNVTTVAVSAKPGPLYWSGQQPQSR